MGGFYGGLGIVLQRQKASYATHGKFGKFWRPRGRYFYEPRIPSASGSLYGSGTDFIKPCPFKSYRFFEF